MITTTPAAFLNALENGFPPRHRAVLRAAMLVTPKGFGISEESATDNVYMGTQEQVDPERALVQHEGLVRKLGMLGVPVVLFPGRKGLRDGVYPNNAFAVARPAAHDGAGRDGVLILGSMRHAERRAETKRKDIPSLFRETFGYRVCDLSTKDCVAELTGPLVIDRGRGIGFCGLSSRADPAGCEAMHEAFGLDLTFRFELVPNEYHTNIVLAVLAGRACLFHAPSFQDPDVPLAIARVYGEGSVDLRDEEKQAFAGNCIAVTNEDVLFSETALRSLRPSVLSTLERQGFRAHGVAIDELEKGGGSLRCLISEIF